MKLQTQLPWWKQGLFGAALLGSLMFTGCVKENLDDCPVEPVEPASSGLVLHYRYDLNMNYADRFEQQVGDLKAFVFDAAGVLCDTLNPQVRAGELRAGWTRRVELAPGTYTVLTWAGGEGFTETFSVEHANRESGVVIGQTRLEDILMALKYVELADGVASPEQPDLHDLYYGIASQVEVTAGAYTDVNTALVKNTNTIRVRVTGVSGLAKGGGVPDAADFDVRLTGRNGLYRYDDKVPLDARLIEYKPVHTLLETDKVTLDVRTVRVMQPETGAAMDAALQLSVTYVPTQTIVCDRMNVVETIQGTRIPVRDNKGNILVDPSGEPLMSYPTTEYLDRQDEFEFLFEVEKKPNSDELVFTVYVNGWKVMNIIPVPK